ncbi:MAG: VanZ family protein [Chitinophagaceae bacterium]|nr:VanZ family protein [Chitinophagaceae bacterium]MCW5929681.1 VanZ family protein [Chitinophagaceae bacterium]
MNNIYKLFYTRWPAVAWTLGIFILLSAPGEDSSSEAVIPYFDKWVHAILCGVHVWFWCFYLNTRLRNGKRKQLFLLVFLITCIYGVLMEYYQKFFVRNRDFEYADMIADITGAAAGWLIAYLKIKGKKIGPHGNEGRNQN